MDLPTPGEPVLYKWSADHDPVPFIVCRIRNGLVDGHAMYPEREDLHWLKAIPYGTAPGCWQWRVKTRSV